MNTISYNASKQFGRQIRRLDYAFENVKDYTMGTTTIHTPTSLVADAKIKKHYNLYRYKQLIENHSDLIAQCRAKYGHLGITKVIEEIIASKKIHL